MSTECSIPKYLFPHPHAQRPHYQHPPSEGDIVTVMNLLGHVTITPNPVCIRAHFWCLRSVDLECNVKCKVRHIHPYITQSVFTALMILCALTTHPSLSTHPWPLSIFYCLHQFSSVALSCPTLCDPMNCSTPGLPVHHQLPESTQTHVH